MLRLALALAATTLIAAPVAAAGPCKDAKGKFIKCPPVAAVKPAPTPVAKPTPAAAATAKCRDAKGHFIKCPTPAAKPAARCRNAKGQFTKCP